MLTQVQKWGNSLALRIPKSMATELSLEHNTAVEIRIEDGCLVLIPVESSQYQLENMLAQITPKNMHAEIDTGVIGNEAW